MKLYSLYLCPQILYCMYYHTAELYYLRLQALLTESTLPEDVLFASLVCKFKILLTTIEFQAIETLKRYVKYVFVDWATDHVRLFCIEVGSGVLQLEYLKYLSIDEMRVVPLIQLNSVKRDKILLLLLNWSFVLLMMRRCLPTPFWLLKTRHTRKR